MKILYIIHSLGIGGAETIVTNYLIELKKMNINVTLVELFQSDSFLFEKLKSNDINVISLFPTMSDLPFAKKIFVFAQYKLCQKILMNHIIKKIKPDIIHFHTNLMYMNRLSLDFSHCFYTFHTAASRSLSYPNKKFKICIIKACKKGLNIIALSSKMKEEILAEIGEVNVAVIPNGIDIKKIRENKINKQDFCEEYGIPMDSFIVGHVGRFHPVKNHEKLIRIFNEIHKRNKNSFLILIGDGEKEIISKTKIEIEKAGLIKNVFFLGLKENASKYMSVFDCFILPSIVEGYPLTIAEAQAQGVKCIATDVIPENLIFANCVRVSINESDEKWANLAMESQISSNDKDIMDIDIENIINTHLKEYKKVLYGSNVNHVF